MDFSVIIPVLHESERINPLIEHLSEQEYSGSYEIIVVDGDPKGKTIQAIHRKEVISTISSMGRAKQMNKGASIAKGNILIFLHVDTKVPFNAFDQISHALEQKKYIGGAFDLGIHSHRFIFKAIEWAASLRSRLTRIPYGDQAIFIRRGYFEKIGGYKEIPLMEDVELMRRIKKKGDKICILSDSTRTSPRRWEKEGVIYCTVRNWLILSLYLTGVSPEKLARFYKKV